MPHTLTNAKAKEKKPAPTFAQLCKIYPRLSALALEAARIAERLEEQDAIGDPDADRFCANTAWYDGPASLRCRVVEIAQKAGRRFGWPCYDIVYSGVYDRLPDCRECGCIRRGGWD